MGTEFMIIRIAEKITIGQKKKNDFFSFPDNH